MRKLLDVGTEPARLSEGMMVGIQGGLGMVSVPTGQTEVP